jgi:hypothetical protein
MVDGPAVTFDRQSVATPQSGRVLTGVRGALAWTMVPLLPGNFVADTVTDSADIYGSGVVDSWPYCPHLISP